MTYARTTFAIATLLLLGALLPALAGAGPAPRTGPLTVKQAERVLRAAHRDVVRARKAELEARHVLSETRRATINYGANVGRWVGCARWAGWPWGEIPTLTFVIERESGGNPRILCGGYVLPAGAGDGDADERAGGLTQCKPAPAGWADPLFNLTYAYRHKYLPSLRQYGNGWQPWAIY